MKNKTRQRRVASQSKKQSQSTGIPEFYTKYNKPLRAIIIWLVLSCYLVLGLYTELGIIRWKPLPEYLLEDFGYYRHALFDALEGKDPYVVRVIGRGYLYPPTALLAIEVLAHIPVFPALVSIYTVVNIILMLLMIYGVANRYGYSISDIWWWFVIGMGFAPFLELIHIGQINMIPLFAVFLMFFWESASPVRSGICLSLGVCTKVTPIVFLGYLFVNRNFKAILATIVGVAVFCIIAWLRYGYAPFVTYIDVFQGLMHTFPCSSNSQSLAAKFVFYKWITNPMAVQRVLTCYILLVFITSGILTFFLRKREPLFIIVGLGTALYPNIMWYHHYVFILLPLFVWMGWSRLNLYVTTWCLLGFYLIQVDPRFLTHGLLVHIFGHISIVAILAWQIYHVVCDRSQHQ